MNVLLVVLFGSSSGLAVISGVLYIIGIWGIFRKSGIPGWWAAVPCAREYMLANCAGREPEGRVTSVIAFIFMMNSLAMNAFGMTFNAEGEMSGVSFLLMVAALVLQLVQIIYEIRVYAGLVDVYGQKRRWLWAWILVRFFPALLWGFGKKYQPAWQVEEFRREVASVTSAGSAEVLTDGLTVNLKKRTVTEFFRRKTLLRDIHLSIPPGHMVLLLGGSGAGKTDLYSLSNSPASSAVLPKKSLSMFCERLWLRSRRLQ